jgi:hypothetical protein
MCAHRSVVEDVGVKQVEAAPSNRDPDTGVRMFCRGCFFKSLQKTLEKRSVVVMVIIIVDWRECVSMQRRGGFSGGSGERGEKVFHGQAQAQERHALARASSRKRGVA